MSPPAVAPDLLRCALPAPSPEAAAALGRPFLRDAVCAALAAARVEPRWATPALAAHFRADRRLGSKDRKRVQDAVYGVIRSEALLRRAGFGAGQAEVEGWAALLGGDFELVDAGGFTGAGDEGGGLRADEGGRAQAVRDFQ
jgi:hypothetical protein